MMSTFFVKNLDNTRLKIVLQFLNSQSPRDDGLDSEDKMFLE